MESRRDNLGLGQRIFSLAFKNRRGEGGLSIGNATRKTNHLPERDLLIYLPEEGVHFGRENLFALKGRNGSSGSGKRSGFFSFKPRHGIVTIEKMRQKISRIKGCEKRGQLDGMARIGLKRKGTIINRFVGPLMCRGAFPH